MTTVNYKRKHLIEGLLKVSEGKSWPSRQEAWQQRGRDKAGAAAKSSYLICKMEAHREKEKGPGVSF